MRIVIATPIYPPAIGGPATYAAELARRLRDAHSVTIVTYGNEGETITGTTLIQVDKKQRLPVRLFHFTRTLYKAARKADVIYVQNALAAGLPAMIVGKLLRKRVVLKFVGDEAWEAATRSGRTDLKLETFLLHPSRDIGTQIRMSLQGFVLRNVSLVTTPSAYLGETIMVTYRIPKERVVTNYNATDIIEVDHKEVTPHALATVARLVPWKGIEGIIRAVAILRNTYSDITLQIAGEGPLREELEALVKDLSLEKHVFFTGTISKNNVHALLKRSAVFILNSTYEGLPHVVLESFAAQTPVVATNIAGTNEVVFHEKTGLLVPSGDNEALAKEVERLLDNEDLRKKLVAEGDALLRRQFTWEQHQRTLLSFFETPEKK